MRVDVFLKQSRLVKRRTLAKELCDEGAVTLNGQPASAGKQVAPGDRMTVRIWDRLLTIEIKRVPERVPSSREAREIYELVSEERLQA